MRMLPGGKSGGSNPLVLPENGNAVGCAEPQGSGVEHRLCGGGIADAAGRLHEAFSGDGFCHQPDILDCGAPGTESGGGFDKGGSGVESQAAGGALFPVVEQAGLEDHLHPCEPGGADDFPQVLQNARAVAGLQASDRKDRINFRRSELRRAAGFKRFCAGLHRAEWKPGHCRNKNTRALQGCGRFRNPAAVHANAEKPELHRFLTKTDDVGARGIRLQERVVNEFCYIHENRTKSRRN